jgi:hypothetical protein
VPCGYCVKAQPQNAPPRYRLQDRYAWPCSNDPGLDFKLERAGIEPCQAPRLVRVLNHRAVCIYLYVRTIAPENECCSMRPSRPGADGRRVPPEVPSAEPNLWTPPDNLLLAGGHQPLR